MPSDIPFGWTYGGEQRPPFAVVPQTGQESVWDYPRPPRLEPDHREIVVRVGAVQIARTCRSYRILETASPPTFYLPPDDLNLDCLEPADGRSICEWKGTAQYWSVVGGGRRLEAVGWSYPDPLPAYRAIAGYLSFYPARVECLVDSLRVTPQPGGFYGGWVTPEIVGPFKGEPGTEGW